MAHRTMFELGVMGAQAGAVEGFVVNEPHGHALRSQYLVDPEVPDTLFGYEEDLLGAALKQVDPQHRRFRERISVIHGLVFPNLLFITTAPVSYREDAQGQTAFTQIRALTPIDQHTHEVAYWNLVPRDASDCQPPQPAQLFALGRRQFSRRPLPTVDRVLLDMSDRRGAAGGPGARRHPVRARRRLVASAAAPAHRVAGPDAAAAIESLVIGSRPGKNLSTTTTSAVDATQV
ncbi:hypothetical protein ACFY2M_35860 [Streptomyces sp. NPDC001276]|uniref:hypothetical protein n=1 Tax=Streptomyces sp. NPDC001276 TaxID=3364555 RepID=UPI00368C6090